MNRTIYETQASNWSRLAGAIIGETPKTTVLLEAWLIIINLFFILLIDVRHDATKEDNWCKAWRNKRRLSRNSFYNNLSHFIVMLYLSNEQSSVVWLWL